MMGSITGGRRYQRTFVDSGRRDLFSEIGRARSPFHGSHNWPYLAEVFASYSKQLLERAGHAEWQSLGGVSCEGGLTLNSNSQAADDALLELERNHCGFVVEQDDGVHFTVQILRSRERGRRFGIGIPIDESGLTKPGDQPQVRPQPIRLAGRAEQLLWLIHSEVMRSRQSLVSIPDRLLKELIWDVRQKPKDWRRDLEMTLVSLSKLRVDVLNLNRRGWQPRLGASSTLLDHLEFSWNLGDLASPCDETCALWGTIQRHHHVRIGIGHAFLGVLEHSVKSNQNDVREYDFKPSPEDRSRIEPTLPVVLGHLGKKGLQLWGDDKSVVGGLLAELTVLKSGEPSLQCGHMTPFISVPCPCLAENVEYLAFNGNGRKPGYGYLIIGRKKTGWLRKTGILAGDQDPVHSTRALLSSLQHLSDRFGLVVVGYSSQQSRWYTLVELGRLARGLSNRKTLNGILLRVYSPIDFLDRVCGWTTSADDSSNSNSGLASLNERLTATGLSQQQLAHQLGVSRPFVSKVLNGQRPWPEIRAQAAEEIIRACSAKTD